MDYSGKEFQTAAAAMLRQLVTQVIACDLATVKGDLEADLKCFSLIYR